MSAWTDTAQRTAARSYAAAGIPEGDVAGPPQLVAGTFSPDTQIRKLLHGLVDLEEIDEAVHSCLAVACNQRQIFALVGTAEGQVASLMCVIAQVIAQVFAHGILYGRHTAGT